ncbi:hypothetical protein FKG94_17620 [Exilibacterium tricleocarpae]|uniref:Right-handed parallel beta-helix repeat-containing protein n=1 Tax=Exilibacterium tricleocarpae TaxID=2591008 RepID=A0A545T8K1_9GAMM|nr:hypothetical protein [Exilibacterium tricleocarpae]TQV73515.1 hypothetical protein FKG94_17620 [Exilibacterium tricleocarpae]
MFRDSGFPRSSLFPTSIERINRAALIATSLVTPWSHHFSGAIIQSDLTILRTVTPPFDLPIHIAQNHTHLMSGMLADGLVGGELNFSHNTMTESVRFIVRALKGNGAGNTRVSFQDNQILGMNSTLSDTSVAARVIQTDAQFTNITNNYLRDLETTSAASLVYFEGGDLNCVGNTCCNAHGTEVWTHDKGAEQGTHVIKANSFDQSGVTDCALDAVIKIYTRHSFTVSDNEFLGLRSPACWVYESVNNAGVTPQQNVIPNNQIRNIQFPFAFKLVQPSQGCIEYKGANLPMSFRVQNSLF